MDFKDLRPATLYNFIQSVKFGTSIEDALVQAYSIEAGFLGNKSENPRLLNCRDDS